MGDKTEAVFQEPGEKDKALENRTEKRTILEDSPGGQYMNNRNYRKKNMEREKGWLERNQRINRDFSRAEKPKAAHLKGPTK